eukprot:11796396-Alexandrium_andersonii.AAC.1
MTRSRTSLVQKLDDSTSPGWTERKKTDCQGRFSSWMEGLRTPEANASARRRRLILSNSSDRMRTSAW